VSVSADSEEVEPYRASDPGDPPRTLGDLRTPLKMTGTAWLITAVVIGAVLSFLVVVVMLGVYTD